MANGNGDKHMVVPQAVTNAVRAVSENPWSRLFTQLFTTLLVGVCSWTLTVVWTLNEKYSTLQDRVAILETKIDTQIAQTNDEYRQRDAQRDFQLRDERTQNLRDTLKDMIERLASHVEELGKHIQVIDERSVVDKKSVR